MDLSQTLKQSYMRLCLEILGNPHPELGNYVQTLNTVYYFSSLFLNTPVYLAFDKESKRYIVKRCHPIQRILCAIVQILASISIIKRVYNTINTVLQDTNYIVPYFDMANEAIVNLFIFQHFYRHWFQISIVEEYVEVLQSTPLLQFCKVPAWKAKFFPFLFWALDCCLTTNWMLAVHQINIADFDLFLESGAANARDMFWLSKDAEVSGVVSIIATIGRLGNCMGHHSILNNFMPTSMLPMFFVGRDFFSGILRETLNVEEVLDLYEGYKGLLVKGNNYGQTYVFYYSMMIMAYNSVHLFDCLNISDPVWRTVVIIYTSFLWFNMYIPTKFMINSKKLKKWLWKDQNYMKIPIRKLVLVLHDMNPWIPRKGIKAGQDIVMSAEVTGSILETMWSFSMIVSCNTK